MPPSLDCRRSIRISVDIQEQSRTITGYRTASKFYRRPPGPGWLAALVAIPLLLGWMGWSGLHRSAGETNVTLPSVDQTATLMTPSVSAPNLNTPTGSLPGLTFAPLSIVRSGNGFTLTGDLPDLNAKNALLDTLRGTFGADVNLTDNLNIKAGVSAPDFTGLGGLFKAAVTFRTSTSISTVTRSRSPALRRPMTRSQPSRPAEGGLAEHQDGQQHSGIAGAPTANHTGTGNWVVCQLAGRHLRSNRDADQLPDRWLQPDRRVPEPIDAGRRQAQGLPECQSRRGRPYRQHRQ